MQKQHIAAVAVAAAGGGGLLQHALLIPIPLLHWPLWLVGVKQVMSPLATIWGRPTRSALAHTTSDTVGLEPAAAAAAVQATATAAWVSTHLPGKDRLHGHGNFAAVLVLPPDGFEMVAG